MSTGSRSLWLVAFGDSHSEFSRIQHPWQDFHWAEEIENNKQHSPICYFSVNKFRFQLLNFQISSQDPAKQTFPHQVLHQQYQHLLAHFLSSAPKLPLENISPDFFIQAKIHSPTKPSVATFKVTLFCGCLKSMRKTAPFPQEMISGVRVHREFILLSALFLSAIKA